MLHKHNNIAIQYSTVKDYLRFNARMTAIGHGVKL